jgi:hypothetical protein
MHIYGRRAYAVRFHPDNCISGCHTCHRHMTENPLDFQKWVRENVGEGRMEIVNDMRNDINLAKTVKKNLPDVARHYREELKRILALRADGVTGKIEVESYL